MLLGASVFLAAMLLFLVEPLVAKMLLPSFGGVPAVWISCVLIFQGLLVLGYACSHAIAQLARPVWQPLALAIPLLFSVALVRVDPPRGQVTVSAIDVLISATTMIGLPFVLLSAISPLWQSMFSRMFKTPREPFFLYAISNLGSFAGLLAFPLVLERYLGLDQMAALWRWLLAACAVLAAVVAAFVLYARSDDVIRRDPLARDETPLRGKLMWLLLAFAPSLLLLAVTAHITSDVAPMPLLWVAPLAAYLLSFTVVFARWSVRAQELTNRVLPFVALAEVGTVLLRGERPLALIVMINCVFLFVCSMACHGQLQLRRPPAAGVTAFYLAIGIGGILGGAMGVLVAPAIFDSYVELPIAIVLASALGSIPDDPRRWLARDLLVPAGLMVVLWLAYGLVRLLFPADDLLGRVLLFGVPALFCFSLATRPLRFAGGLAALLAASALFGGAQDPVLIQDRNFFGVATVLEQDPGSLRFLRHGTTIHGAQDRDPARRRVPLTYYYPTGPIGRFLSDPEFPGDAKVGVIGLGVGSLACYARPQQAWTFYEIDPLIVRIARDESLFTFLAECAGDEEVVLGDGRLSVDAEPQGSFDLLVVDAFNSDVVPVHLITKEAIEMYLNKLDARGWVTFHVSNRFVDLRPIVARSALDLDLGCWASDDSASEEDSRLGKYASRWMVIGSPKSSPPGTWGPCPKPAANAWTDQRSDLVGVTDWF